MLVWITAALAAGAATLVPAARPARAVAPAASSLAAADHAGDWMHHYRLLWCLLAAAAAATFVDGVAGVVAAPLAAVGCWIGIDRAEPAAVRAHREAVRRDLPHLVRLLSAALAGGVAPGNALAVVAAAFPGPASEPLVAIAARLRLGADPVEVWGSLAGTDGLAPLGRTLARAHSTGTPVAAAVARLADDLARAARADVEDRARAVGVKAAVPLGLCLLPAFLLIGVVPLVGGLMSTLLP